MFAGAQLHFPKGVISIEGDEKGSAEKKVFRISGGEIQLYQPLAMVLDGVADKIHIKSWSQVRYGADELHGKGGHCIIIDIQVFIQPVKHQTDASHIDIFTIVHSLV